MNTAIHIFTMNDRSKGYLKAGRSSIGKNLNENLETLHLAPTLFYHLSGFYIKTGILNPHPLYLFKSLFHTLNLQDHFSFIRWNHK